MLRAAYEEIGGAEQKNDGYAVCQVLLLLLPCI